MCVYVILENTFFNWWWYACSSLNYENLNNRHFDPLNNRHFETSLFYCYKEVVPLKGVKVFVFY